LNETFLLQFKPSQVSAWICGPTGQWIKDRDAEMSKNVFL